MTATINASTSAGVVTTADTSGILQLQTNGTAALTVATSANVGIGTASPTGKLNVDGGAGNSKLKLSNTASGNTGSDGFDLDFTGTDIYITNRESGFMAFENNGAERARIPSTGGIQSVNSISVGNTAPSTSGAGITFPATQSASSDANTLDDYEEGTWTPTGNGVTYTGNPGKYTKIGDFVFCAYALTFPSTASASGAQIQGLPFSVGSQPRGTATVSETDSGVNPIMMALSGTTAFIRDASNSDRPNSAFSLDFLNGMIIYRV